MDIYRSGFKADNFIGREKCIYTTLRIKKHAKLVNWGEGNPET